MSDVHAGSPSLSIAPHPPAKPVLLAAANISKRFGVTQALDDVSVTFLKGEIHALMGENGAGKSTLGKVISGLHRQDTGTVTIFKDGVGRELVPGSIDDAFAAGVRIVHQELAQCPQLTVAENLCLHDLPTKFGLLDRRTMNARAAKLVHRLDPSIDVEAPLGSLAPGRRQICQIAASLDDRSAEHGGSKDGHGGPSLIVFDEPTSSLSVSEADRLMEITRQLATQGMTIVYVSHRMGEIFAVCDRVSVLRDGKFVATSVVKDLSEGDLVEQMIGRRLATPTGRLRPKDMIADDAAGKPHEIGKVMLSVRGLNSPGKLREVSLDVRAGEVVGIGGLVGAGRSETLDAIFSLDPKSTGRVEVEGKPLNRVSPADAIRRGVGYVPEDRRLQGLFFQLGVGENIIMPFMDRLAMMLGIRSRNGERQLVTEKFSDFRVKAAGPGSLPSELSGGNQQKLLIARWMGRETRVLLLDEPTRGIDVGTKAEVYKLIHAAADRGMAVLLVSSEMPELLALSDRILVMAGGRITGELAGDEMTQTNILRLAVDSSVRASA
ncbi:MAG: sugar ABC transporter ATP-binding protein [Planctomycetota bacterium]